MEPIDLINHIRETDRYIKTIFTHGGCYRFHLLLKSIYPESKLLISGGKDHALTEIAGIAYDINGVSKEPCREPTVSEVKLMESWSFSGKMMLSIGECEHCEEPILITPQGGKGG